MPGKELQYWGSLNATKVLSMRLTYFNNSSTGKIQRIKVPRRQVAVPCDPITVNANTTRELESFPLDSCFGWFQPVFFVEFVNTVMTMRRKSNAELCPSKVHCESRRSFKIYCVAFFYSRRVSFAGLRVKAPKHRLHVDAEKESVDCRIPYFLQ